MSDKFGRHKSTRWVKAVPTYDNNWGEEYDYDYGSDDVETKEQPSVDNPEFVNGEDSASSVSLEGSRDIDVVNDSLHPSQGSNDQISHHSGLVDEESHPLPPPPPLPHPQQTSNLVLSIDNLRPRSRYDDDSSDEDDEEEAPEPEENEKVPLTIVPVKEVSDPYMPPTPVFNNHPSNPETPLSEFSYQSDADSIQREPITLNVGPINHSDIPELHSPVVEPVRGFPDTETIHEIDSKEEINALAPAAAPLVLSVDELKSNDDSDDDWGYNSQHSSNDEAEPPHNKSTQDLKSLKITKSPEIGTMSLNKKPIRTDALDSLISDLEQVSVGNDSDSFNTRDNSFLPRMDSIHDLSLPDFENNSFAYSSDRNETFNLTDVDSILEQHTTDDIEGQISQPPTPVAPLSYSEAKRGHESFVQDLSGHRPSIRKPPPSKDKQLESASSADAPVGIYDDQNSIQDSFNVNNKNEPSTNGDELRPSTFDDNELKPVISSGSLSTGKLSVATSSHDTHSIRSDKEPAPVEKNINDDVSRRMSTMTNNTFSLGAWKPNTGNYRDQFINDNDNESQFSFNPSIDSGYSKFTNVRDASGASFVETSSNASSLSVPETIDIALPRIAEDNAEDSEDDQMDDKHKDLHPLPTNTTSDTVLKDHEYPQPVFKEERMTPHGSLDNVPFDRSQDASHTDGSRDVPRTDGSGDDMTEVHNSVVSDSTVISDDKDSDDKRLVSGATDATDISKRSYIQAPRPKYNWKQIMSTSQPIDRIRLLKEALEMESVYDTGLLNWLHETLKLSENTSNMHVGKIASEAYQNAAHQDIRRHGTIRSKVSIVKDKVETSGLTASSLGKRFFSKGRKLMKSGSD